MVHRSTQVTGAKTRSYRLYQAVPRPDLDIQHLTPGRLVKQVHAGVNGLVIFTDFEHAISVGGDCQYRHITNEGDESCISIG